jgi:isopenicillin N synthase-like dioxygenase
MQVEHELIGRDTTEPERRDFRPRELSRMAWHSEAEAPAGVPVLDLAVLGGAEGSSAKRRTLDALREAATWSGLFYVKNHGIADDVIEAISDRTRGFFGEPDEYKKAFDRHMQARGYATHRSESMTYTMGPELSSDEVCERITSAEDIVSNAYSPNVFPHPRFRDAWLRYYDRAHRTSLDLLGALGDALDLGRASRSAWSETLMERSGGTLRYFQYPDAPQEAVDPAAAHASPDVISLLHHTPCDNGDVRLEARIGERLVKVPALRGALVVAVGEVLRQLSGGTIEAATHRVARPSQLHGRGSACDVIAFSQAPALNARLRPIVCSSALGRAFGPAGPVTFSQLRARLFGATRRPTAVPGVFAT